MNTATKILTPNSSLYVDVLCFATSSVYNLLYQKIERYLEERLAIGEYFGWLHQMPPSNTDHPHLRFKKFSWYLPEEIRNEYFSELLRRKRIAEFAEKKN